MTKRIQDFTLIAWFLLIDTFFKQGIYASGKFAKSNLATISYQEEYALIVTQLRQKYLTDWQGLLCFYLELISQFAPCPAHNRLKVNINNILLQTTSE